MESARDIYWITSMLTIFVVGSIVFGLTGNMVEYFRQEKMDLETKKRIAQQNADRD